ncbi:MAG: hypothetical protein E7576_04135 [Ruminococcaceae bacterium]|nr:hypothetical protein [Oscillospiraceae bacterium]
MEKKKASAIWSAVVLLPVLFGFCGTPVRAEAGNPGGSAYDPADTEAAARQILGSNTPLEREKVGTFVLYSCPNGYVLTDPADGCVVEYALSFPGKEPVFVRPVPDSGSAPGANLPTE